jgi:hypothetical protein
LLVRFSIGCAPPAGAATEIPLKSRYGRRVRALLLLASLGCGSPPSAASDAAPPDAAEAPIEAPAAPSPPAEPAPPERWACADGSASERGCAPRPLPPACEGAAIALGGDIECTPLGPACPLDGFSPETPAAAIFVRAGGDGDGTRERPFGTIAAALERAPAGATIAIAEGLYDESVALDGVDLLGACTEVVIAGSIDIAAGRIRRLTVRSPEPVAIRVRGSATLDDVFVDAPIDVGVAVEPGARLEARRLVVRSPSPPLGRGIFATDAELDLDRVLVTGAAGTSIRVLGGAATIRNAVLRDPTPADVLGVGLVATDGAEVEASDVLVSAMVGAGVYAQHASTRVALDRVDVRDTARSPALPISIPAFNALEQDGGNGIVCANGARIEVRDSVFTGDAFAALFSHGGTIEAERISAAGARGAVASVEGSVSIAGAYFDVRTAGVVASRATAVLEDAFIRGDGPPTHANAAIFARAARVDVSRTEIADFTGLGVIGARGSQLDLRDLRIADLRPVVVQHGSPIGTPIAMRVTGIAVADSTVSLARVRADGAEVAVEVSGSSAQIADLHTRDVRVLSEVLDGRALVAFGSRVRLDRALFEINRGFGLDSYASTLEARDLLVRDSTGRPNGWGIGLEAREGSVVTLERVAIEASVGLALGAEGAETRVRARDASIAGVAARECTEPSCGPAGIGVGVYEGAQARLERFVLREASLCGAQIGPGSELELSSGRVSENAIGACVHSHDYAIERLTEHVIFERNELSIETASVSLPDPPAIEPLRAEP